MTWQTILLLLLAWCIANAIAVWVLYRRNQNNLKRAKKMCDHCNFIRMTGDMTLNVILPGWKQVDILQLAAYFHARIKHEAIKHDEVEPFETYWNELVKVEVQELHRCNPLEPKQFNEAFDFRNHLTVDPEDHR